MFLGLGMHIRRTNGYNRRTAIGAIAVIAVLTEGFGEKLYIPFGE